MRAALAITLAAACLACVSQPERPPALWHNEADQQMIEQALEGYDFLFGTTAPEEARQTDSSSD